MLTYLFYQRSANQYYNETTSYQMVWSESKRRGGTWLVVHWLRVCLAMQGMQVQSLVKELGSHKLWRSSGAHMPQVESPCITWCNSDPTLPNKYIFLKKEKKGTLKKRRENVMLVRTCRNWKSYTLLMGM